MMMNMAHKQWVEIVGAVISEQRSLGAKILHRDTIGIKFHRYEIIGSKAMNRKEIISDIGCN